MCVFGLLPAPALCCSGLQELQGVFGVMEQLHSRLLCSDGSTHSSVYSEPCATPLWPNTPPPPPLCYLSTAPSHTTALKGHWKLIEAAGVWTWPGEHVSKLSLCIALASLTVKAEAVTGDQTERSLPPATLMFSRHSCCGLKGKLRPI